MKEKSCGRATVHLTRNESQTRSKSELVVSAVVIHLRADHPLPLPPLPHAPAPSSAGRTRSHSARAQRRPGSTLRTDPASLRPRAALSPSTLPAAPSATLVRRPDPLPGPSRARARPAFVDKMWHLFPCALFLSTIFVAVLASVHFVDKNQPFLVWILALYWLSTKNKQKWPFCRQKGCFEPFCRQNQGVNFHSA